MSGAYNLIVGNPSRIGELRLGMSREQVDNLFKEVPRALKRQHGSRKLRYYYVESGIQVEFTSDNVAESLAGMTPAEVMLDGTNLLGLGEIDAQAVLHSVDSDCVKTEEEIKSTRFGISLWLEQADYASPVRVTGVFVFPPG